MVKPLALSSDESLLNLSTIELQANLHEEIRKLTAPRLGVVLLDICICSVNETPTSYESVNVCHLLQLLKYSNAYLYLHPKYNVTDEGSDFSQVMLH